MAGEGIRLGGVEGEVVHLLQHLPEAVTVAEEAVAVILLRRSPAVVMAEGVEEVPLVVVAVEARHPNRAPRLWLRNRLPNLLLPGAEEAEGAELPPVALTLLVVAEAVPLLRHPPVVAEEARRPSRTLHWLLLLLAARTTRRLHQHPRRRLNQCFLRTRALAAGKLLRRVLSPPLRHPHPSSLPLQPSNAPLAQRSSPPR